MQDFDVSYLSIDSILEGVGQSQILPIIRLLAAKGLAIQLISCEKQAPPPEIRKELAHLGVSWEILNFGRPGLAGGMRRLFAIKSAIGNTKVIHARGDIPAFAGIISRRAPVLWDFRAFWSDQRLFMTNNLYLKLVYRLFRVVESFLYRKSAAITALSKSAITALEYRYRRPTKICAVVPTYVDLMKFKYVEKMPVMTRALFLGTYNRYYDLNTSRAFLTHLRSITNVQVGWARPLEAEAENLDIGESEVFPIESWEIPKLISEYSFGVSICNQDAGISMSAVMPTKIAEFLAVGRPVLINKGLGDYDHFIRSYRAGVVVDTETDCLDERSLELITLLEDPDTSRRCRQLAEEFFDSRDAVDKYIQLYRAISSTSIL